MLTWRDPACIVYYMSRATSTDQTYLVDISAYGVNLARYEVDAPNVTMARHFAQSMAARDADVPAANVSAYNVILKPTDTEPCEATAFGDVCEKTGAHAWHFVSFKNGTSLSWTGDRFEGDAECACVICGTPYNPTRTSWNRCCSDPDNIEEV